MTLTEYITEAVSKRTTGKYLMPTKEAIFKWLESNKFKEVERPKINTPKEEIFNTDKRVYCVGPNSIFGSDWVSMHSNNVYELVFWFDERGNVTEIERRTIDGNEVEETFDNAVKIMGTMIK